MFDIVQLLIFQFVKLCHLTEVYHFHDMIEMLVGCGYKKGTTLFGYGYDFRQSNRSKFAFKNPLLLLPEIVVYSIAAFFFLLYFILAGSINLCSVSKRSWKLHIKLQGREKSLSSHTQWEE